MGFTGILICQFEQFRGNMKYFIFISISFLLCGCTLSFQNISTHGTATDLVDENQSPQNDISPTITAPMGAL